MVDLRSAAEEYFRSISSIARRVCDDVQSTRENYESAWDYLSSDEQHQVLDESLIYPDAVLKYSLLTSDDPLVHRSLPSSFPSLQISYGCKILQDETGTQWRDEHSAPFSWKTSSQLLVDRPRAQSQTVKESAPAPAPKKRPPVPPPKPPKPQEDSSPHEESPIPPEPEQSEELEQEFCSMSSQNIPKTGCAFLDNW